MSDPPPFLPEHSPAGPPPQRDKAKRTLLLWVVLIVGFLAVWHWLEPDSPGDAKPAPPPTPETNWYLLWVVGIVVGMVLLVFYLILRRYLADTRFNVSQEPGGVALAERRFEDAVQLFRATEAKHKNQPVHRSVIRVNVAHAELWAGRIDAAIAALVEADRGAGTVMSSGIRTWAAAELAVAYSLSDELDAAAQWLGEARARIAKTGDERLALAARVCLAEALLACRREAFVEAEALVEKNRLLLRHAFNANLMRVVEVVGAFAAAQANGSLASERLQRVAPVTPNEFDFLGHHWPEMGAFLAAHGLSR